MIREHLFSKRAPADPNFRWRGSEMSRIESLSDGVFALIITLLVVSASAPRSFYDLWIMVQELPAFIVSFIVILLAWHSHYIYFRRYGLEDFQTIVLNSIFLFIIMFFAYPLKFLAMFLWFLMIGEDPQLLFLIPEYADEMPYLMSGLLSDQFYQRVTMMNLYSFGVVGLFGILTIMYIRPLLMKDVLELDSLEIVITQNAIIHHSVTAFVAIISLIVLHTTLNPGLSGIVYFLMPLAHGYLGWLSGKRVRKIKNQMLTDKES